MLHVAFSLNLNFLQGSHRSTNKTIQIIRCVWFEEYDGCRLDVGKRHEVSGTLARILLSFTFCPLLSINCVEEKEAPENTKRDVDNCKSESKNERDCKAAACI